MRTLNLSGGTDKTTSRGPTSIEGREGEVRQVPAQLGVAGRLLELAVGFIRVELEVKGRRKYTEVYA